jgi:hypothetical protein
MKGRMPGAARLTVALVVIIVGAAWLRANATPVAVPSHQPARPPPAAGYFSLAPVGSWEALPTDTECAGRVHRSAWEPRPENTTANHTMPNPHAVHASLAARPRARQGAYDPRWDSWLLPRVDGQFTGTTDEIFQWAACKWGLPDNLLRGIAVRESTWYQGLHYVNASCLTYFGCGDRFAVATAASRVYCDAIAKYGPDYQLYYGSDNRGRGLCPRTFSIVGVMSWQDPAWGAYPDNQNGTFPFNRDSTAFAVDYLGAQLRGCYEGWEFWLKHGYRPGDIWGCVGAWYAGNWHSAAADGYALRVRTEIKNATWLKARFAVVQYVCDPVKGCPVRSG